MPLMPGMSRACGRRPEARIGRAVRVEPKHREVIGWRVVLAADHELPVGLLQHVRRKIGIVRDVDGDRPLSPKEGSSAPVAPAAKRSRQAGGEDDANRGSPAVPAARREELRP